MLAAATLAGGAGRGARRGSLIAAVSEHAPDALRVELLALFAAGVGGSLAEDRFDDLARRVCLHQLHHNPVYAAYARRRGVTPEHVPDWTRIPALPTAAFKELPLVAGDAAAAQAVFRTSGTTLGAEKRGEHHVLDLGFYHASLLPTFRAFVLPDRQRIRMISLLPPPSQMPDSSLAHMIGVVMDHFGAAGSVYAADAAAGLNTTALDDVMREAEQSGEPVCLLGTSFTYVHWLDGLAAARRRYRLPEGSRLMDTGGFKGRAREFAPTAMRHAYAATLGIPPTHAVNEYGMTELLSQRYDASLRDGSESEPRVKAGPPWLRTLAADPETLEPLPAGATGLLRHVDLANMDSVLAVQTEDLGHVSDEGVVVLGRAPGAVPRGCSIASDIFLAAVRERR